MSIKFACSCGKAYKVPEKFSGKRVKCKQCGEAIHVPSQSQGGVASARASAVSKRSVLESQRLQARSSRREAAAPSGRSSSRTSGRTSTRASATSGRSRRTSARSAAPGGKTERFAPVDLTDGNALKKYAAKKEEEFKRGEGRLTLYQDGKPIKAYRLTKKEASLGRGEGCGIRLDLASVSRDHARIEYKLGTFIVTDQQSKNGLVVNGRQVRRSSLRNGDILQIGEGVLRLDC